MRVFHAHFWRLPVHFLHFTILAVSLALAALVSGATHPAQALPVAAFGLAAPDATPRLKDVKPVYYYYYRRHHYYHHHYYHHYYYYHRYHYRHYYYHRRYWRRHYWHRRHYWRRRHYYHYY